MIYINLLWIILILLPWTTVFVTSVMLSETMLLKLLSVAISQTSTTDQTRPNRGCLIIIWTGLDIKMGIVQNYMSDQAVLLAK